jgi:uncharacterized protein YbaR (Trm112 family)
MLKTLASRLACPACFADGQLKAHSFAETAEGQIRDGVLVCDHCRAWYPIDDRLLELVTESLIDRGGLAAFSKRWQNRLQALGLQSLRWAENESPADVMCVAAQLSSAAPTGMPPTVSRITSTMPARHFDRPTT